MNSARLRIDRVVDDAEISRDLGARIVARNNVDRPFVLSTEAADGSWHVVSRAPKFQVYFESGFPYGSDQWISAWATGWASMALAQSIPTSLVARVPDLRKPSH